MPIPGDSDEVLARDAVCLLDVPTPAGPTPPQIGIPAQATLLPVIEINRKPTKQ
ncbi:hypothetical protein [Streptomyces sp. NBC_00140]|uniref:hypothetical protein n=1 Tax=Streptomyces sp. NBC_00140 TaxID=2975664 RepID=UPI002257834F|nr:hypothetical protein [Streptomyces sp. NBC_00140]MCX5328543.1 hypothetical protein [Streptomyces sp. NBC_00140]